MKSSFAGVVILAAAACTVEAVLIRRTPHTKRSSSANFKAPTDALPSFEAMVAAAAAAGNSSEVGNYKDLLYATNITIGGQEIAVQLDTGSSDLWVSPQTPLPNSTVYPVSVGIRYGIGSVEGNVTVASLSFSGGDYSIPQQAFLTATSADMDNLFDKGVYGIFGLGFDSLSAIVDAVNSVYNEPWGATVLSNLFAQSPSTPNFIAFLLDRAGDLDQEANGSFTVGEHVPEFAAVAAEEHLPTFPETGVTRWTTALAGLTVDGKSFPMTSVVPGAPAGQSIALLDTGASLMYASKAAVDFVYESFPGSVYASDVGFWVVPCLGEGKLDLQLGTKTSPVHPLDLSMVVSATLSNGTDVTVCIATIREMNFDAGAGEFDFLLGDAFLRNVYSVFDFGDTDPATGLNGAPYIQLLSITNTSSTSAEFQRSRSAALASLPPTIEPSDLAVALGEKPKSGSGAAGALQDDDGAPPNVKNLAADSGNTSSDPAVRDALTKLVNYAPYMLGLLGLNALLALILVGLGIAFCVSRLGKRAPAHSGPAQYHQVKPYE